MIFKFEFSAKPRAPPFVFNLIFCTCGVRSDLVPYLERNMVGMFKQLDSWVKGVLPVLPYSSLQDSVLHLLQVILFIDFNLVP
jgi:hypothetical protein